MLGWRVLLYRGKGFWEYMYCMGMGIIGNIFLMRMIDAVYVDPCLMDKAWG